ncbi:MAG: hypothetical protein DRN81_03015 [Thermoproteota archaeon]|nr:MAG: hypothetical protein DRN81_03015 [Candidatus Korarchaeota archaeon]
MASRPNWKVLPGPYTEISHKQDADTVETPIKSGLGNATNVEDALTYLDSGGGSISGKEDILKGDSLFAGSGTPLTTWLTIANVKDRICRIDTSVGDHVVALPLVRSVDSGLTLRLQVVGSNRAVLMAYHQNGKTVVNGGNDSTNDWFTILKSEWPQVEVGDLRAGFVEVTSKGEGSGLATGVTESNAAGATGTTHWKFEMAQGQLTGTPATGDTVDLTDNSQPYGVPYYGAKVIYPYSGCAYRHHWDADITKSAWEPISDINHAWDHVDGNDVIPNVTTTDNGLMSNTDKVKLDGIGDVLDFKGVIAVNTSFPLAADVEVGWTYIVSATVTDDAGGSRTNTGQTFDSGDEITWSGSEWTLLGVSDVKNFTVVQTDGTDLQLTRDQVKSKNLLSIFPDFMTPWTGFANVYLPFLEESDLAKPIRIFCACSDHQLLHLYSWIKAGVQCRNTAGGVVTYVVVLKTDVTEFYEGCFRGSAIVVTGEVIKIIDDDGAVSSNPDGTLNAGGTCWKLTIAVMGPPFTNPVTTSSVVSLGPQFDISGDKLIDDGSNAPIVLSPNLSIILRPGVLELDIMGMVFPLASALTETNFRPFDQYGELGPRRNGLMDTWNMMHMLGEYANAAYPLPFLLKITDAHMTNSVTLEGRDRLVMLPLVTSDDVGLSLRIDAAGDGGAWSTRGSAYVKQWECGDIMGAGALAVTGGALGFVTIAKSVNLNVPEHYIREGSLALSEIVIRNNPETINYTRQVTSDGAIESNAAGSAGTTHWRFNVSSNFGGVPTSAWFVKRLQISGEIFGDLDADGRLIMRHGDVAVLTIRNYSVSWIADVTKRTSFKMVAEPSGTVIYATPEDVRDKVVEVSVNSSDKVLNLPLLDGDDDGIVVEVVTTGTVTNELEIRPWEDGDGTEAIAAHTTTTIVILKSLLDTNIRDGNLVGAVVECSDGTATDMNPINASGAVSSDNTGAVDPDGAYWLFTLTSALSGLGGGAWTLVKIGPCGQISGGDINGAGNSVVKGGGGIRFRCEFNADNTNIRWRTIATNRPFNDVGVTDNDLWSADRIVRKESISGTGIFLHVTKDEVANKIVDVDLSSGTRIQALPIARAEDDGLIVDVVASGAAPSVDAFIAGWVDGNGESVQWQSTGGGSTIVVIAKALIDNKNQLETGDLVGAPIGCYETAIPAVHEVGQIDSNGVQESDALGVVTLGGSYWRFETTAPFSTLNASNPWELYQLGPQCLVVGKWSDTSSLEYAHVMKGRGGGRFQYQYGVGYVGAKWVCLYELAPFNDNGDSDTDVLSAKKIYDEMRYIGEEDPTGSSFKYATQEQLKSGVVKVDVSAGNATLILPIVRSGDSGLLCNVMASDPIDNYVNIYGWLDGGVARGTTPTNNLAIQSQTASMVVMDKTVFPSSQLEEGDMAGANLKVYDTVQSKTETQVITSAGAQTTNSTGGAGTGYWRFDVVSPYVTPLPANTWTLDTIGPQAAMGGDISSYTGSSRILGSGGIKFKYAHDADAPDAKWEALLSHKPFNDDGNSSRDMWSAHQIGEYAQPRAIQTQLINASGESIILEDDYKIFRVAGDSVVAVATGFAGGRDGLIYWVEGGSDTDTVRINHSSTVQCLNGVDLFLRDGDLSQWMKKGSVWVELQRILVSDSRRVVQTLADTGTIAYLKVMENIFVEAASTNDGKIGSCDVYLPTEGVNGDWDKNIITLIGQDDTKPVRLDHSNASTNVSLYLQIDMVLRKGDWIKLQYDSATDDWYELERFVFSSVHMLQKPSVTQQFPVATVPFGFHPLALDGTLAASPPDHVFDKNGHWSDEYDDAPTYEVDNITNGTEGYANLLIIGGEDATGDIHVGDLVTFNQNSSNINADYIFYINTIEFNTPDTEITLLQGVSGGSGYSSPSHQGTTNNKWNTGAYVAGLEITRGTRYVCTVTHPGILAIQANAPISRIGGSYYGNLYIYKTFGDRTVKAQRVAAKSLSLNSGYVDALKISSEVEVDVGDKIWFSSRIDAAFTNFQIVTDVANWLYSTCDMQIRQIK